jgi:hypothetical protein
VKQALQGAGLVPRGRKRGAHRKRRERRPLPGMLLHIDGSRHQWFQDERWYDLIVILDDASSEIYYAQLVEEESTATVMAGLKPKDAGSRSGMWRITRGRVDTGSSIKHATETPMVRSCKEKRVYPLPEPCLVPFSWIEAVWWTRGNTSDEVVKKSGRI